MRYDKDIFICKTFVNASDVNVFNLFPHAIPDLSFVKGRTIDNTGKSSPQDTIENTSIHSKRKVVSHICNMTCLSGFDYIYIFLFLICFCLLVIITCYL